MPETPPQRRQRISRGERQLLAAVTSYQQPTQIINPQQRRQFANRVIESTTTLMNDMKDSIENDIYNLRVLVDTGRANNNDLIRLRIGLNLENRISSFDYQLRNIRVNAEATGRLSINDLDIINTFRSQIISMYAEFMEI